MGGQFFCLRAALWAHIQTFWIWQQRLSLCNVLHCSTFCKRETQTTPLQTHPHSQFPVFPFQMPMMEGRGKVSCNSGEPSQERAHFLSSWTLSQHRSAQPAGPGRLQGASPTPGVAPSSQSPFSGLPHFGPLHMATYISWSGPFWSSIFNPAWLKSAEQGKGLPSLQREEGGVEAQGRGGREELGEAWPHGPPAS